MRANEFLTEDILSEEGDVLYENRERLKKLLVDVGISFALATAITTGGMTFQKALDSMSLSKAEEARLVQKTEQALERYADVMPVVEPKKEEPNPVLVRQAEKLLNKPLAKVLEDVAINAGLKGDELAQFLAQCAHETLNFKRLTEIGGSLDFRKYDPKYNPKKAKRLGNTEVGDGSKYKGRGYIQLTGRYNYRKAGEALDLPLEEFPELVEDPKIAAEVALWYWNHRVQPRTSDFSDTHDVTRFINPARRGLDDRENKYIALAHHVNFRG